MFESKSRYYSLDNANFVAPNGRIIIYKKRRFLPKASNMQILAEVTVSQSDRLDLIASRVLGDPEQFWRICDANNALNPKDLTATLGRTLRISAPQF